MAISHKDHDHPNTPAARAACRKATGHQPDTGAMRKLAEQAEQAGVVKPTKVTVVPRTRGDGGVVQGMKNTKPKPADKVLKRPGAAIKAEHDLGDVPRMFAYAIRLAWAAELPVVVGDRFTDLEARIVIKGAVGEVALTWRDANPDGLSAIFIRHYHSPMTYKVDGVQHALELVATEDGWTETGSLRS